MSWKFDENIFHQKCPKQQSLVTENVPSDACDDIPSKNHENFTFFSCMLITVGLPIVNACAVVALHQRSGTTFLEVPAP